MKKLFLASIALVALNAGGSALAADIPVKARPAPPPPAVYSWTGFYVGGNIGYSWGKAGNDWDILAPAVSGTTICAEAFCVVGSDSNKVNGVIGGLQAGYNWQYGWFLVGLETDIQASGQKGDQIFNARFPAPGDQVPPGILEAAYTHKLQWLGTTRGRIGFATDWVIWYATGGVAYGRVTHSGSVTATGTVPEGVPNPTPCDNTLPLGFGRCTLATWTNDATKVGWTLGAGVEGAFAGNWSWRIEYLHVDLGDVTTNFTTLPGCFGNATPNSGSCRGARAGQGTIETKFTDEIVRVGINYRFY